MRHASKTRKIAVCWVTKKVGVGITGCIGGLQGRTHRRQQPHSGRARACLHRSAVELTPSTNASSSLCCYLRIGFPRTSQAKRCSRAQRKRFERLILLPNILQKLRHGADLPSGACPLFRGAPTNSSSLASGKGGWSTWSRLVASPHLALGLSTAAQRNHIDRQHNATEGVE